MMALYGKLYEFQRRLRGWIAFSGLLQREIFEVRSFFPCAFLFRDGHVGGRFFPVEVYGELKFI